PRQKRLMSIDLTVRQPRFSAGNRPLRVFCRLQPCQLSDDYLIASLPGQIQRATGRLVFWRQIQERGQRSAAFDNTGCDELWNRQDLDFRAFSIKRRIGDNAVRCAEINTDDVRCGHANGGSRMSGSSRSTEMLVDQSLYAERWSLRHGVIAVGHASETMHESG